MATLSQRSFSGGEIAPALHARVDQVKYQTGLRKLRNFFVMRHGGAATRPGTEFVAIARATDVRLIPFVFNNDQTYVLEFSNQKIRIHLDGAPLRDTPIAITGITNANPAVVTTSGAHGLASADSVHISLVGGMTELNGKNFNITVLSGTTFSLQIDGAVSTDVDSTAFGAFTSGGLATKIIEVVSPYGSSDLAALRYVQSADVMTIVHPSFAPREFVRTSALVWSIGTITFAPAQAAPTSLVYGSGGAAIGAATPESKYKVTALTTATYEESLPSSQLSTGVSATAAAPIVFTWTAAAGAAEYNVYKSVNGIFGFIGISTTASFTDLGYTPDTTDTPPIANNPFSGTDNWPTAVAYFQQRLGFANTNNAPETVWLSRSGMYNNFTISRPLQSDDSISFTVAGRQVNSVKHLLDLGTLVSFTQAGEWSIQGDSAGIVTPTDINPKPQTFNGSGTLAPITIDNTALYLQDRGSIVRDLVFEFQSDGYKGNDLTIFSAHLVDGYSITDWTFQKTPHSMVWAVRSDGTLLGLTYVKEHQILGWSRHDTSGYFTSVCAVPEGDQDSVYVAVQREIDGETRCYIERMTSRSLAVNQIEGEINFAPIVGFNGMDSSIASEGINTPGTGFEVTLSGGTTWEHGETLTLTCADSRFSSDMVDSTIFLYDIDSVTGQIVDQIQFVITGYSSATVVTGISDKTVPASLRDVSNEYWALGTEEVTGLWHLEGEDVAVFADGFVVASPNNPNYTVLTVTDGAITLPRPAAYVRVGLPYTCDLETLDIDSPQGESIADKKKFVSSVTVHVEGTRGAFIGPKAPEENIRNTEDTTLYGLYELKIRQNENYNEPVSMLSDHVTQNIAGEWNSNGRVFIRQVDPLPLTVLSISPSGLYPFKG